MFCGYYLQPHEHRFGWRRIRCQIHDWLLSNIHAGLGESTKPFFENWQPACGGQPRLKFATSRPCNLGPSLSRAALIVEYLQIVVALGQFYPYVLRIEG